MMKTIRKTKGLKALCIMAVLAAGLFGLTPLNACAASDPLTITVEQVFTTSSTSAENSFTYALKPIKAGHPMPGTNAAQHTFAIDGTARAQVGPLVFTQPGVYHYQIFQVIGTEKPGYTYDRRVYTIEVHVDANHKTEVVIFNEEGTKTTVISFKNSHKLLPSDPALMVDPPVKKTVSGSPSKDATFTFKLTAGNPANPMPPGSANGVKTLTVVGSGEGEFGVWSYDKPGVYFYTVSEVNAGEAGYTYDTMVYTITDTVKEANGQLVQSRVVTNNANKQVTTMGFINKYSGGGGSGGGGGGGNGPKTGDDSNPALNIALLVLGGAVTVGAAVYLIATGKRKKAK